MGGVKDVSDKVRAAYNPGQNYLALQNRFNLYQPPINRTPSYRGFNYFQHRKI